MAKRLTPNQKAWAREMARIEDMARSIGIKDVPLIKPKTPEKITKKHIAQAEAIGMDYVREKAQLESANITPKRQKSTQKSKSVGKAKKPDYIHKPRKPAQPAETKAKKQREYRARKKEEVRQLPRAAAIAVSNFFSQIEERLSSPRATDNLPALQYYFNSMRGLLGRIGESGFARLLFLADQEAISWTLALPPSEVSEEWAMGAVTALLAVAKKYNLQYAKSLHEIWEETDERMEQENFNAEYR